MSKETLKKINSLLKNFNSTFELKANLIEEDGEKIVDGLIIDGLKGDGSGFINELHETFNTIVQSLSKDHEVIYNEDKGLVIAKKVVVTEYVIDDLD